MHNLALNSDRQERKREREKEIYLSLSAIDRLDLKKGPSLSMVEEEKSQHESALRLDEQSKPEKKSSILKTGSSISNKKD